MSLTIVATPGAAGANSFCTEAEAIAFAATRLNLIGWTTLSGSTCAEVEKQALMEATRELSALVYPGFRASETQALAWPRELARNPDAGTYLFMLYDATVIPQRLKDATCELAFEFLKAGTTDIAAVDPLQGITRKQVDVLVTDYAAPSQRPQGLARFPRVLRLLAPLIGVGPGQVRLTR